MSKKPSWAVHCDTEIDFFDTEDEAVARANDHISVSRAEAFDGWDEATTDWIVVLKVVHRAKKVDPNADYRLVDYELRSEEDELSEASPVLIEALKFVRDTISSCETIGSVEKYGSRAEALAARAREMFERCSDAIGKAVSHDA